MAKIFKYAVKYKGKYYPPNTPIVERAAESRKSRAAKPVVESKPPIVEQVTQNECE